MPDGKIVEVVATGGIGDFEVDGGVEKGCVPQVSGQHRESMLRGSPAFFDGLESIDGKGMAQTMGRPATPKYGRVKARLEAPRVAT